MAETTYERDLLRWRQDLDDSLRSDNGWLTLAGLFWLHQGENTVGSTRNDIALPVNVHHLGVLKLHNGQVTFHSTCDQVMINNVPVASPVRLEDDHAESGATHVSIGSIIFYIIKRENQFAVRVRDLNHPARQSFTDRKWFAIDPSYCLKTSLIYYTPPRATTVLNTVGLTAELENPGYVTFELHGKVCRLDTFTSDAGELWFIFKDATNGVSTYSACRYLKVPRFTDDSVTLDFNRAYNPPCAFTPHATCPLPPAQNWLPVAVEAGERI
jgi:uncharacterized protein